MSLAFMDNYARIRKQMFPQCQPQPVVIPIKALPKPKPVIRDVINIATPRFSIAPAYMPPGGNWHIKERAKEEEQRSFQVRKTARQIIAEIALEYDVSIHDILSHRRLASIVAARHMAVYRMKKETRLSFPQMGRILNRDHSTLVYSYHKIEAQMARPA